MSDPLENELRRLTPVSPSPSLDARIAAELNYTLPARGATSSLSDTLLRSLLSLAAAAVVVIVTLLASDWTSGAAASPAPAHLAASSDTLTISDTPRLLAQLSDTTSAVSIPPTTIPN